MKLTFLIAVALATFSAVAAQGHEFWLSAKSYSVKPGQNIVVSLRVGSNMKGATLVYQPNLIARFDMIQGGSKRKVKGQIGDDPAMVMAAEGSGLVVVVHETGDNRLTYDKWETFLRFVTHKDFPGLPEAHAARGLPEKGFAETYRRYAKALIAVGDGAGADRAVGLRIEIVALANPYTDDLSGGMPLLVLLDGVPRADAQVELFETRPDGSVTSTFHRTNAAGKVTVPVRAGSEYMADNVDLVALPNNDISAGSVWHSDWASLTFRVPAGG